MLDKRSSQIVLYANLSLASSLVFRAVRKNKVDEGFDRPIDILVKTESRTFQSYQFS